MAEKFCDFCEIQTIANWTCIDCVKYLCVGCKAVHNKIPVCKTHKVVPTNKKLNFQGYNIGEDYFDQTYLSATEDAPHLKDRHDLQIVLKESENQNNKLLGHLQHLKEETIPCLEGQLSIAKSNRESYSREVKRVSSEIKGKALELKKDVDSVRDHLLRALKEREEDDLGQLTLYENSLIRQIEILNVHLKSREKQKNKLSGDKEIAQRISKIKQDMDEAIPVIRQPIGVTPPRFVPYRLDPTLIEGVFGYLESKDEANMLMRVPDGNPDSFSSYSCTRVARIVTNGKVNCMATGSEGNAAWLSHPGSVELMTINGDVLRRILVQKCKSMSVLESQDELVLVMKNGKFARVLRTGNVMYIDTSFFRALALTVTLNNEVLVCFSRTTASPKELETSSSVVSSKISRFSHKCTGKPLQEYVLESSKVSKGIIKPSSKRLTPCFVKENYNRDICTIVEIDGKNINKPERKVFVMQSNGKARFYYGGADKDYFQPDCLTCDMLARIIVSDKDRIHLLNADGQFLSFILTFNDHLHTIHCLDTDKEGKLWLSVSKKDSPEHDPTVWVFKRMV